MSGQTITPKHERVKEEIWQNCMAEKTEVEMKEEQLKVELEKNRMEQDIIHLVIIEHDESQKKVT